MTKPISDERREELKWRVNTGRLRDEDVADLLALLDEKKEKDND